MVSEIERIKAEYLKRSVDEKEKFRWSPLNPGLYYTLIQREKHLLRLLVRNFGLTYQNITNKTFLDVGCGSGHLLQRLVFWGAKPENLFGVDLMENRIKIAKKNSSHHITFYCSDAQELPFANENFDFVFTFTVFTSILTETVKRRIAKEMLRVLKPDGAIIWYDFYPHPFLRNVTKIFRKSESLYNAKPIGKKEIKKLFPGCSISFFKIGLHRLFCLPQYSWIMCELQEKIPILHTHYLAVIQKGISSG